MGWGGGGGEGGPGNYLACTINNSVPQFTTVPFQLCCLPQKGTKLSCSSLGFESIYHDNNTGNFCSALASKQFHNPQHIQNITKWQHNKLKKQFAVPWSRWDSITKNTVRTLFSRTTVSWNSLDQEIFTKVSIKTGERHKSLAAPEILSAPLMSTGANYSCAQDWILSAYHTFTYSTYQEQNLGGGGGDVDMITIYMH